MLVTVGRRVAVAATVAVLVLVAFTSAAFARNRTARFRASLSATFTATGTLTDADCDANKTGTISESMRVTTRKAGVVFVAGPAFPIVQWNNGLRPTRLRATETRQSALASTLSPRGCFAGQPDAFTPDCGTRTLLWNTAVQGHYNRRRALDGLTLEPANFQNDPFDHCPMPPAFTPFPGPGDRVSGAGGGTRSPVKAIVSPSRLLNPGIRRFVLTGKTTRTRHDDRGSVSKVTHTLIYRITLVRVG